MNFDHSQQLSRYVPWFSVSNVVELPGAGLGRVITINSELNGASEAGRASVKIWEKNDFQHQFSV